MPTEDWQDPESSLARQLAQAEALARGHGRIVAQFSDVGKSRTVACSCEQVIDMLRDVAPPAVTDPDEGGKLAYLLAWSRVRADERAEQLQGPSCIRTLCLVHEQR